jgi:hypothetical protein
VEWLVSVVREVPRGVALHVIAGFRPPLDRYAPRHTPHTARLDFLGDRLVGRRLGEVFIHLPDPDADRDGLVFVADAMETLRYLAGYPHGSEPPGSWAACRRVCHSVLSAGAPDVAVVVPLSELVQLWGAPPR